MSIQVTGSEEIRAADILSRISNGENICEYQKIIVNDLDLSKIKDPITGKIEIKASVFEGSVNLAGKTFEEEVNFSGTTFREDVNLFEPGKNATFKKNLCFNGANFKDDANFIEVSFDNAANFDSARFNGRTNFKTARFGKGADFDDAQFDEYVSFSGANFSSGHVTFQNTKFEKDAYFYTSKFRSGIDNSGIDFSNAQFGGKAYFRQADFSDEVNFRGSYFLRNADFRNVNFGDDAVFEYAYFNEDALFDGANFSGKLNLNGSRFDRIQLSWRDIKGSDKLVYNDEVYLHLIESYRSQGRYSDADECYYRYRVLRASDLSGVQKGLDYLANILYGYGVKPTYPIRMSVAVILGFTLCYRLIGSRAKLKSELKCVSKKPLRCTLKRSLWFSLKVFLSGTKPFSSDLVDFSKIDKKYKDLALLERFLGMLLFILFLITITNTVIIK